MDILATLMGFPFKTTYSICGQQKVTFIIIYIRIIICINKYKQVMLAVTYSD